MFKVSWTIDIVGLTSSNNLIVHTSVHACTCTKQECITSVFLLSQVLKIEEGMSAEMYVKLLYMGLYQIPNLQICSVWIYCLFQRMNKRLIYFMNILLTSSCMKKGI